jgi:hypothetical protein
MPRSPLPLCAATVARPPFAPAAPAGFAAFFFRAAAVFFRVVVM